MNRSHRAIYAPGTPRSPRSHTLRSPWFRARVLPFLTLLLAVVLAGCSGNLTAGGVSGDATVTVSGDAEPEGTAAAPAHAPARSDHDDDDDEKGEEDDEAEEAEGEIEAELRLFLVTDDGVQIPLTDGDIEVEVDVQGREEADVVQTEIPARTYSALRVVFSELEVEIESGLILNGLPFVGIVDVDLDGDLTVDRALDLVVQDGESVNLLVDLNARSWLLSADPLLGVAVVAEGIVRDAIEVRIR